MWQETGFELLAVGTVVDPFTRGRDPLASGNGCGMANHGDDITMSARFGPKNAEAVLDVVVGDAFDETSQHFRG
jgi:hypothetical protein